MCFGTDPNITSRIQWYWASPTAVDLGFPTPFTSRTQDKGEVMPAIGEVNWERRKWTDGTFPISVPGTRPPCGDMNTWLNGLSVGAVTGLPRNQFGLAECCGGLQDFPGQPTFGLQVDIVEPEELPALLQENLSNLLQEDGDRILIQTSDLLLENGWALLQENGSKILVETSNLLQENLNRLTQENDSSINVT